MTRDNKNSNNNNNNIYYYYYCAQGLTNALGHGTADESIKAKGIRGTDVVSSYFISQFVALEGTDILTLQGNRIPSARSLRNKDRTKMAPASALRSKGKWSVTGIPSAIGGKRLVRSVVRYNVLNAIGLSFNSLCYLTA